MFLSLSHSKSTVLPPPSDLIIIHHSMKKSAFPPEPFSIPHFVLVRIPATFYLPTLLLFHFSGLCSLLGSILHLLVGLLLGLGRLLGFFVGLSLLLSGLLLGLFLCAFLGGCLFGHLPPCVFFLLSLVVEAPNHDSGGGSQLLQFGDVLCLGGVFAIFVQPVLETFRQSIVAQQSGSLQPLTSSCSHFALIFSFSSSLANSA